MQIDRRNNYADARKNYNGNSCNNLFSRGIFTTKTNLPKKRDTALYNTDFRNGHTCCCYVLFLYISIILVFLKK